MATEQQIQTAAERFAARAGRVVPDLRDLHLARSAIDPSYDPAAGLAALGEPADREPPEPAVDVVETALRRLPTMPPTLLTPQGPREYSTFRPEPATPPADTKVDVVAQAFDTLGISRSDRVRTGR